LDVFFFEAFEEERRNLARRLPGAIAADFSAKTIQEWGEGPAPAAVISTRTQSIIPAGWAGELKGILTRSTGYDHIVDYLRKCRCDIPCGYLPTYCQRAVAEQVMMLVLALLRRLPGQIRSFARFQRDGLTGRQCRGRKLLVAGVGNIGGEIVQIAQALGMEVRGVDIVEKHPAVIYVTIEEGLAWAEVIVCAMNLTADNVEYFNYARLKQAERGVIFINIARGEMSPSGELLRLVDEGHLGGLGLDVYNHESRLAVALRSGATDDDDKEVAAALELAQRENVILLPHNSFNTEESTDRKAQLSVEQLEHFFRVGEFIWPVPR